MAGSNDVALMAHLLRRAGFNASRDEIETAAAKGYDTVVEELLNPGNTSGVEDDLMLRYHPTYNHPGAIEINIQNWVYRMVNTEYQLKEKMALFWHMIFCAGHSKIDSGEEMGRMVQMFRDKGMGSFQELLMELSTSPAMVYYLDNSESHKDAINENYGRELLELFSMGVGMDEDFNYSEDDVKACGPRVHRLEHRPADTRRSPTAAAPGNSGLTRPTTTPPKRRSSGKTGNWNGDDILNMIAADRATARFISRHLYNYFVADEVPVPSWRQTPPKDERRFCPIWSRRTSTTTTTSPRCSAPCSTPTRSRTPATPR